MSCAEERLARRSDEHGLAEPLAEPAGVREQCEIVLRALAETDARVDDDLRGRDARGLGARDARSQLVRRLRASTSSKCGASCIVAGVPRR